MVMTKDETLEMFHAGINASKAAYQRMVDAVRVNPTMSIRDALKFYTDAMSPAHARVDGGDPGDEDNT